MGYGGKAGAEAGMTQRFLVWATQRITLLFIKIENEGGEAGLGGKRMSSVLNLLLLRCLQSDKVLMSTGWANTWVWGSRKKMHVRSLVCVVVSARVHEIVLRACRTGKASLVGVGPRRALGSEGPCVWLKALRSPS